MRTVLTAFVCAILGFAATICYLMLTGMSLTEIFNAIGHAFAKTEPYLEQGWQWLASGFDRFRDLIAIAIVLAGAIWGVAMARMALSKSKRT